MTHEPSHPLHPAPGDLRMPVRVRRATSVAGLVATLGLGACATMPPAPVVGAGQVAPAVAAADAPKVVIGGAPQAAPAAEGTSTLYVIPQIASGGYRTLAVINPFTAADIHHLDVKLQTSDGSSTIATATVLGKDLAAGITFTDLKRGTIYRLQAEAYRTAGSGELISKLDADSRVNVQITNNDQVTVQLKVNMADRVFSGTANDATGVQVNAGGVVDSAATPTGFTGPRTTAVSVVALTTYLDGGITGAGIDGPVGIAVDNDQRLFVGVLTQSRIALVNLSDGQLREAVGPIGQWTYTAVDRARGFFYGTDVSNNRVAKFDLNTSAEVASYGGFSHPGGPTVDPATGTLYVPDSGNHTIKQITTDGTVSLYAGATGVGGTTDGARLSARFGTPHSVAHAPDGTLYVADADNHRIRKIAADGTVSTLAGSSQGHADGRGAAAKFYRPQALAVDPVGNVYVADTQNSVIRKVSRHGDVSTFAGKAGVTGNTNGAGPDARFNKPAGIAVDSTGVIYVGDEGNDQIRKLI